MKFKDLVTLNNCVFVFSNGNLPDAFESCFHTTIKYHNHTSGTQKMLIDVPMKTTLHY